MNITSAPVFESKPNLYLCINLKHPMCFISYYALQNSNVTHTSDFYFFVAVAVFTFFSCDMTGFIQMVFQKKKKKDDNNNS